MNIFETKSKYFHNSNSWFAGKFWSFAITTTIVFILLFIAYSSIRGFFMGQLEKDLNKAVATYFTGDFQCKGLKLQYNMNDGEGEFVEFLYRCKEISHPKLVKGKVLKDVDIIVSIEKTSDDSIVIDHVGFKWTYEGTTYFKINNWYDFLRGDEDIVRE